MQSAAPAIEPLHLSTADAEVQAALAIAEDPSAAPEERAEMLMEIARGLQIKPRSARQLHDAVTLYRRARSLVPPGFTLLAARIRAREGTAHQALPDGGVQALLDAQDCYEQARADLAAHGLPEETAELDMNLGLVSQTLVGAHRGRIQDAIAHYHRALRVFTKEAWPREFSILHNNLAIAYLSIPATDERARMREALAVQSFEEVLQLLTLVDHPSEYAMTQNNLGNALQYAPSSHPVANLLRAIEAYDEALKVRTRPRHAGRVRQHRGQQGQRAAQPARRPAASRPRQRRQHRQGARALPRGDDAVRTPRPGRCRRRRGRGAGRHRQRERRFRRVAGAWRSDALISLFSTTHPGVLSMMTSVLMCLAAVVAGAGGGAATGIKIGGEAMGNQMAALMGGFFGLSAVAPAAVAAVLINSLR